MIEEEQICMKVLHNTRRLQQIILLILLLFSNIGSSENFSSSKKIHNYNTGKLYFGHLYD